MTDNVLPIQGSISTAGEEKISTFVEKMAEMNGKKENETAPKVKKVRNSRTILIQTD